jgi:hypothetical protein
MTNPASDRFKRMDAWSDWWAVVLILCLVAAWSAAFSHTFTRPFEWDDLHLIRQYSLSELLSTLHGPEDPDGVETPALRPVATLLFHLQGTIFGEDMLLQRVFMIILMGGFLWLTGVLLRELGLSFLHIAIVLMLFTSSRAFASLVLWITNGALILAYILMASAALFYLRWIKEKSACFLAFSLLFTALAVMTREEAYTLPLALPLLWWLSRHNDKDYRRPILGALCTLAVVTFHYILRTNFIPDAPQPGVHAWLWRAIATAWFPGGAFSTGWVDRLMTFCWLAFVVFLAALAALCGSPQRQKLIIGICALSLVLSAPALGAPRAFGTALPSLASFTAISILIVDVLLGTLSVPHKRWRPILISTCVAGLALGVAAGVRRSIYVAQALDPNAAGIVIRNFGFLHNSRVTIPEARRQDIMAHLSALGIQSQDDVEKLMRARYDSLVVVKPPIFVEKYDYLFF